jgi:hypothetical protein
MIVSEKNYLYGSLIAETIIGNRLIMLTNKVAVASFRLQASVKTVYTFTLHQVWRDTTAMFIFWSRAENTQIPTLAFHTL